MICAVVCLIVLVIACVSALVLGYWYAGVVQREEEVTGGRGIACTVS